VKDITLPNGDILLRMIHSTSKEMIKSKITILSQKKKKKKRKEKKEKA